MPLGLAKTSLRVLLVLISLALLFYLAVRGSGNLLHCHWGPCSVVVALHWFEPMVALLAALYLSREFWSLTVSRDQGWSFDGETPAPYDANWQEPWNPPNVYYDF